VENIPMPSRTCLVGIALAATAAGACGGYPQSPSPVAPAQTTQATASLPTGSQPANSIAGQYALTLDVGSGCSVVPEEQRVRYYDAAIDSVGDGSYVVTLAGDKFLNGSICTAGQASSPGVGCNQFFASQDSTGVRFTLDNHNDDTHGGHIVERFSSGAWAEIVGEAAGSPESASISASGTGKVWYCSTSGGYPFPCSNPKSCATNNMQLKFTRK
jgi:hypothetical protein